MNSPFDGMCLRGQSVVSRHSSYRTVMPHLSLKPRAKRTRTKPGRLALGFESWRHAWPKELIPPLGSGVLAHV